MSGAVVLPPAVYAAAQLARATGGVVVPDRSPLDGRSSVLAWHVTDEAACALALAGFARIERYGVVMWSWET